jgi:GH15 family glucan-1,4-alpha-glucosidase
MNRTQGYAPIADYGAVGDGRSIALVAADGSIDWCPAVDLDADAVLSAILDWDHGGRMRLEPETAYESERAYLDGTNVLQTTFRTRDGVVRVTDAFDLNHGALLPWSELARRVEGLAGRVPMRWSIEPRFGFGTVPCRLDVTDNAVIASGDNVRLALLGFGTGQPFVAHGSASASFVVEGSDRLLLALVAVRDAPLPLPERSAIERRLDATSAAWKRWSGDIGCRSPWRREVIRSALALRLLQYAPSGAIAAAPTTSLPERIGGPKNYDYRYAWLRDTSFTVDALLRLGLHEEADAAVRFLGRTLRRQAPWLEPFVALSGRSEAQQVEQQLDLRGYRGSRPVRAGNRAHRQLQLGNYGDVFETMWLYHRAGHVLDAPLLSALAACADFVCDAWKCVDSGIWELPVERGYTVSKMGCWVALDRALRFAAHYGADPRRVARWRTTRAAVRRFVESRCWSERRHSYTMAVESDDLDAACLLAPRTGFEARDSERVSGTIAAVRRELGDGSLVYRYSGMEADEGAFVACSFWLAEALAGTGALDDAADTIGGACAHANDVGLFSEQVDPVSGALLGNFPQALSHLAFISAVSTFHELEQASRTSATRRTDETS